MEVITIESKAFKDLMEKVNTIAKFVVNYQPEEINEEEAWVDGYEVCTFLKISERTLQRLRTKGLISYSIQKHHEQSQTGKTETFPRKLQSLLPHGDVPKGTSTSNYPKHG
jgi:hypothetical protein